MTSQDTNTDADEVARFEALAARWWDPQGAFKALHDINPLRLAFVEGGAGLAGRRVLDVGCGPGALLGELVARVGAERVAGVDPAEGFVAAARDRYPGTVVHQATAEQLPFGDNTFDAALAQLVVHFMSDPVSYTHLTLPTKA